MDLVVAVLAVAVVVLTAAFIIVVRALVRRLDAAEEHVGAAQERAARAPDRSRAVNMGKIGEQFAPLLPDFMYAVKYLQWVGGKVDAIVWNGLEASKSGLCSPDKIEVVLLEVKTGKYARLDQDQRLIRDAVRAGRVRFDELKLRPDLESVVPTPELMHAPQPIRTDVDTEQALGTE